MLLRRIQEEFPGSQVELTLKVGERKMKAKWSTDLMDDLQAFHGIDPEVELSSLIIQGLHNEAT